ncbi:unnamed protein product, partial [Allacma fusca]
DWSVGEDGLARAEFGDAAEVKGTGGSVGCSHGESVGTSWSESASEVTVVPELLELSDSSPSEASDIGVRGSSER